MLGGLLRPHAICNTEHPRRDDERRPSKIPGAFPHVHEGVIDNLLESLPTTDQAPQETRKFWVKSVIEGLERTRVTRRNAVHKRTLIDRHARNRVGQLIYRHLFILRSCQHPLNAAVSATASSSAQGRVRRRGPTSTRGYQRR